MSDKLKACSFCGSDDIAIWVGANNGTCTKIYCNRCSSGVIGTWGGNEEDRLGKHDAIRKWNARPLEDDLQAKLERAKKYLRESYSLYRISLEDALKLIEEA